jgi:hypothetical protein
MVILFRHILSPGITCKAAPKFPRASGEWPRQTLRQKSEYLNRINAIWAVKIIVQKYSDFQNTQISSTSVPSRPTQKGRLRDRHGRRVRDAVDAKAAQTSVVKADGEVVWSWRLSGARQAGG